MPRETPKRTLSERRGRAAPPSRTPAPKARTKTSTRVPAQKPAKAASKSAPPTVSTRCSAPFQVLRCFVVRALAAQRVPTVEIAKRLANSRSFVIKQTTIPLKPRNAAERRILKVALEVSPALKRAGAGALLGGEDVVTILAGGERPKLGSLKERREAAASRTLRSGSAKPKTGKPKDSKPRAESAARPKAPVASKPSAPKRASKPAPKAKRAPKAKSPSPVPAETHPETPAPEAPAPEAHADIDDLFSDVNETPEAPDAPEAPSPNEPI